MKVIETELPGVVIVEPAVYGDARGFFKEIWQGRRYGEVGIDLEFVQDNLSRSSARTLRGLHYQIPHAQGKLVQALAGEVFDVAVDLRRGSATFGHWTGVSLSESNHRQMYVPPGFAHGFCVVSETADVLYKCTDFYFPESERTLLWTDPSIGIEWPLTGEPILSEKDQNGVPLAETRTYDEVDV